MSVRGDMGIEKEWKDGHLMFSLVTSREEGDSGGMQVTHFSLICLLVILLVTVIMYSSTNKN